MGKSNFRRSALYLLSGNLSSKVVSFIGSILVARILFPKDYGYLLVADIFVGLIRILGNVGFENYYLQEKFVDKQKEDAALQITFLLRLLLNVLLFLVQLLFSYLIQYFYGEDILGRILRIYAFGYLITGVFFTSQYILRKELNFKPESISNFSNDVVRTIFNVTLVYMGVGVLSFAYSAILGTIAKAIVILKNRCYVSFKLGWDKELLRKIIFFGKHSLIGGVGFYIVNQIDKLVVSKLFKVDAVGYYKFGSSYASMTHGYLLAPFDNLLLSFYAKKKDDLSYVKKITQQAAYALGGVMAPVFVSVIVLSPILIEWVFGAKWNLAIPIFQLFLIQFYFRFLFFPFEGILLALGYPHIVSKFVWLRGSVLVVTLLLAIYFKLEIYSFTIAFVSASILSSLIKVYFSFVKLGIKVFAFINHIKSILFLLVAYVITSIIFRLVDFGGPGIIWELITMHLFTMVFISFKWREFYQVYNVILNRN